MAKSYRLRWDIEVMWRGLKQTLGHHKMLGKTPDVARAELDWAMAGLWMLQLLTASRIIRTGKSPRNHSPAKTLRIVRQASPKRIWLHPSKSDLFNGYQSNIRQIRSRRNMSRERLL